MKLLVTGCLGTIGRPLCRRLIQDGHEVVGVDQTHQPLALDLYRRADVADFRELESAWRRLCRDGRPIDLVFHLAAEFGRINGREHFERVWKSNCIGLRNVLNVARDHSQSTRVVHASTSEVYGDRGQDQLEEELADQRPRPLNDYAISKYANELQLQAPETKVRWSAVRIFNVYGPGEVGNARRSVIAQFVLRLLQGQKCLVYRDTHRDALFIDDAVEALSRLADARRFQRTERKFLNLSGGQYHSIKTVFDLCAQAVAQATGQTFGDLMALEEIRSTEPGNSPHKRPGDARAADKILEWSPATSISDGIARTVKWAQAELASGRLLVGW